MKYENLSLLQVKTLAAALAQQLDHRGTTIGFIGALGAGKTTFIQAFCKALGVKQTKSPSFVIAHQYQTTKKIVYHLDFYRLHKQSQLEHLGLEEILSGKHMVLIEWVDRFPKLTRLCDLLISLKFKPNNKRDVAIKIPNDK